MVELWGYKISKDGRIIGLSGCELMSNKQVGIRINNKYKSIETAKLIYYAFHQDSFDLFDKNVIVKPIDKNKKPLYSLDNLKAVKRQDVMQGENHTLSKLTNKQVEEIKNIYFKKKKEDDGLKKNNPHQKVSYRMLADKYGVSHTLIMRIIKGTTRNKHNYVFKGEK